MDPLSREAFFSELIRFLSLHLMHDDYCRKMTVSQLLHRNALTSVAKQPHKWASWSQPQVKLTGKKKCSEENVCQHVRLRAVTTFLIILIRYDHFCPLAFNTEAVTGNNLILIVFSSVFMTKEWVGIKFCLVQKRLSESFFNYLHLENMKKGHRKPFCCIISASSRWTAACKSNININEKHIPIRHNFKTTDSRCE